MTNMANPLDALPIHALRGLSNNTAHMPQMLRHPGYDVPNTVFAKCHVHVASHGFCVVERAASLGKIGL